MGLDLWQGLLFLWGACVLEGAGSKEGGACRYIGVEPGSYPVEYLHM